MFLPPAGPGRSTFFTAFTVPLDIPLQVTISPRRAAAAMAEEKKSPSELPSETLDFAHRMFDAARDGTNELLLQAVDAGLPANLTNEKGNTLLMLAAYSGHAELTRGLLSRGADPNRLNDRGQSIVAGAVFKGEDEVVKILVEGGADPRAGTPNAIQSARMFGKTALLEVLGAKEGEGTDIPPPVQPPSS